MEVWGSGKRREVAEQLAHGLKKEVRWPTSVFLPADSFEVMCNGPSFEMLDNLGSISVIEQFEKGYGIHIPNEFWVGRGHATFGEIVEATRSFGGARARLRHVPASPWPHPQSRRSAQAV
jgi:hypothetical protein